MGPFPECPVCGQKIVLVTMAAVDFHTGKAHFCAVEFFGQLGLETVTEVLGRIEAEASERIAQVKSEREEAEHTEVVASFSDALSSVSTLEDIMGEGG